MKKPFTHLGGTSGRVQRYSTPRPNPGPALNLRKAPVSAAPPQQSSGAGAGGTVQRGPGRRTKWVSGINDQGEYGPKQVDVNDHRYKR